MNNLGLSFTRLTLINQETNGNINYEKITQIIDKYLLSGNNLFEVDNNSPNNLSQNVLRKTLVERYPRDSFKLLNKLPTIILDDSYDKDDILQKQLDSTGVDYFDYYLIDIDSFSEEELLKEDSYKFLSRTRDDGKIQKIGISFSTRKNRLEQILNKYSQYIDVVEIPINYLDWNSKGISSKDLYDIATRYDKEVIACDVFKNRRLISLEDNVREIYENESSISVALRFILSLDNVSLISAELLNIEELEQAIEVTNNFEKLTGHDYSLIDKAVEQINNNNTIKCIGCGLCDLTCPMDIPVSEYLSLYNNYLATDDDSDKKLIKNYYQTYVATIKYRRASTCISCSQCIDVCPAKVDIITDLYDLSRSFDF